MLNLEKEIREQPQILASIREANQKELEKVVSALRSSAVDNVYFAARGTSDHASIYAQYLYQILLGIPCALATPSVVSKYHATLKLEKSLVIGVSQSGKAEDVLGILKNGNACGAITVAITNNPESPMAKEATYHLYCNAGLESSIAATKTFTSQMYLLALLGGMWADKQDFLTLLAKVPNAVEELLSYMPEKIEEIVPRYRYLKDAVVLGRGFAYPIALEGALKILETNRVRMKGYAISDFHHGPLAQISATDLTIVLAPKGETFADAVEMIRKLDAIGAEVLVISDDAEYLSTRSLGLQIPSLDSDFVAPFCLGVTMQLIALKLTIVKGIDPDMSPVLNKITITR